MTGRILPRMPSYAHYSQTLIPHMHVLPRSIHLHKNIPSVLHLPLWVSTTGRIRKSQSPKLVLDTLWKKPLPNKLSHLERVVHRPDNLPPPINNHLPHLERGYTQAKHELTLASKPCAVQHYMATTTIWEKRHGLPKKAHQS
jgi:hypothetical protein